MSQLGSALIKTSAPKTLELLGRNISPRKVDKAFTVLSRIKEAAVSDEQAHAAINRLDTLERNKPTLRQAARYGAIGAAAGPMVSVVGNAIAGKPLTGGASVLRSVAGDAAKGAIAGGAVPLLRSHLDRRAEVSTLKNYLSQQQKQAFVGELIEITKAAAFDKKKALLATLQEAGPALGAITGAGLAGGFGKSPLSGAAMGYGVGSLPEMIAGKKLHHLVMGEHG